MTGSVIQRDSGPNIYSSFIIEWILFKTNKQKPRVDISPPVLPEDKATHSKWCGEETRKTLVPVYCSLRWGLWMLRAAGLATQGGEGVEKQETGICSSTNLCWGAVGLVRQGQVGTNMPSWSFWELRGALCNRLCEMKAPEASEQWTNSGTLPFLELSKTWDPNNTSE